MPSLLKARKWILAGVLTCCVLYAFPCLRVSFSATKLRSTLCGDCGAISGLLPNISDSPGVIHVAFFGKHAYKNMKITRGMSKCLGSILRLTTVPLHFHVLLDLPSKLRVSRAMAKLAYYTDRSFEVSYYNVDKISEDRQQEIDVMRKHFFTKDVGRYNDDIFFISVLFHRIFQLDKIIFIDIDLKFMTDIRALYRQFQNFLPSNIIGIGNDLQPQYLMDFSRYRVKHPGTTVGSARPGQQGFNTGVVLFDLERMRRSKLYNSLLYDDVIEKLCKKYLFRGYLGHQDFYTITGMEHPNLYHILDCTWNRQLDVSWSKNVPPAVFEEYHACRGEIKIYHGNGNSIIPDRVWNVQTV